MNEFNQKILVIGYGEMGHAMEFLLAGRYELVFHDILPMEGHESVELAPAAAQADFIIYCVPVTPLGGLAERVAPVLGGHSISLSVAKGLDDKGRPAARIFQDVYAERHDYAVLYGPMISEEIRAGRPAFAQVGVSRPGVYGQVAELFTGTTLALEYSADIQGISWSSVLKNVYALLFGAALPAALLLLCLVTHGWFAAAAGLLAASLGSLGIVVERWLFFAEARHSVTLYYGAAPV